MVLEGLAGKQNGEIEKGKEREKEKKKERKGGNGKWDEKRDFHFFTSRCKDKS